MTSVIIILLVAAVLFFILSFFQKNENKHIEDKIDEIASQWMFENFELRKRVTDLEKALKLESQEEIIPDKTPITPSVRELLKKQVITLYTSGVIASEIAEQSELSKQEVDEIIEEYLRH